MSIKKLFKTLGSYKNCDKKYDILYTEMFMEQVIDTFLDQSDMMADLQKQLAQKEDAIAVKDIKEVRLLNGEYDICGFCKHYESDSPYCDIRPGYGELCEADTCNDFKEGD